MALDRRSMQRDTTLRPSRWPPHRGGGPVLRWALVAALLVLAAGVLYLRQPQPTCPDPAETPLAAASGPASGAPTDGARLPLPAGAVGVPIRLAEPASVAVVRPGVRVDLLAVPAAGGSARTPEPALVAARVLVLDVLEAGPTDGGATALYLALQPDQAHRAIGMPDPTRFAIIVRA